MNDRIETVNIINEKWDYLVILDACRYDYFEMIWKKYLPANSSLSKRRSPGSCTDEWRDISFPDYYEDIVYIAANPQFCVSKPIYGYCAGDHFGQIHEVWKDQWDTNLGTVKPETMTDTTIEILKNSNLQGKRVIIHYMQPHAPYLSLSLDPKGFRFENFKGFMRFSDAVLKQYKPRIKVYLYKLLLGLFKRTTIFGNHPDWTLRRFLRLPPLAPMEYVLQNFSVQELRTAYQDNLKKVLTETARLIKYLEGTIVITSDHGEFLGEKNNFSHPRENADPILHTIPWVEIFQQDAELKFEKSNCIEKPVSPETSSDEQIIERLRDLGYHD